MSGNDVRKYRSVTDAEALHTMHPQLGIHHARMIPVGTRAHPARRRIVEARPNALSDELIDLLVAIASRDDQILQRIPLLAHLTSDAQRQSNTLP